MSVIDILYCVVCFVLGGLSIVSAVSNYKDERYWWFAWDVMMTVVYSILIAVTCWSSV